ncbi:MAG: tetratricopeptide repeat protein [Planctomycetota bacterium]|jgi:tetratricopeptide (TPR) repeat protein
MSKEIHSTSAAAAAPRRTTWAALLPAAVIVLAGAAAYHNSFSGPFIFDDPLSITANPTIQSLWPIWRTLSPPAEGQTVTGRPLVNLSLAVNYAISGFDVWSYHVFNLVVHVLAGLVLYGVVRRTLLAPALRDHFGRAATPLALAVALIWTVHPLQTESVTYIVQRAESIVALFYLLTLYCVIRGYVSSRPALWHIPAVLACLLGMASKEVMVSAPLIVLLYDRTFLAGSFKQALRRRWGLYIGLAATWVLLAVLVIQAGGRGGTVGFATGLSPGLYLLNQFRWIARYLRLSFWADPLVLDYGERLTWGISDVWPHAILVVVLGAATLWAVWRRPKVGFLGAWFFAMLAPTSSVVPVATQVAAEHRMYLALAAVVGLSVMGAYELWQRLAPGLAKRARYAASGYRTAVRNRDYRSELAIWQATVDARQDNPRAHEYLAVALTGQGELSEAIKHLRRVLRIDPECAAAHSNLGCILMGQGKPAEAAEHFQQALRIKPNYADAHNNLGMALAAQGKPKEAIEQYRKALEINKDLPAVYSNLGLAYAKLGKFDEAVENYRKALDLEPDMATAHYNFALVLAWCCELDAAIYHLRQAVRSGPQDAEARRNLELAIEKRARLDDEIDRLRRRLSDEPDSPGLHFELASALVKGGRLERSVEHLRLSLRLKSDHVAAVKSLAWLLATRPQLPGRDSAEALRFAERACRLTGRRDAGCLEVLSAAYAAAGRFELAQAAAQEAINVARPAEREEAARRIGERLKLYKAGKACHEMERPLPPGRP